MQNLQYCSKAWVSKMFFYEIVMLLVIKDALNWSKVTAKIFIIFQNDYK